MTIHREAQMWFSMIKSMKRLTAKAVIEIPNRLPI